MPAQRHVIIDSPALDLDSVLGASEDLAPDPGRAPAAVHRLASRVAGSPVAVGAVTLVGGLLLAGVVAGLVASTSDAVSPRPVSASTASAGADGPSTGDARQGLSPDAAARRGPAAVLSGPSTGDARRGVAPDSALLRSGWVTTYVEPDSADSADRRSSTAASTGH
jgi:hypothetical protein